jgi:hypothetical protein
MPARVAPGLKVVADDDSVEADFLGMDTEVEQLNWSELLSRSFVTEAKRPHTNSDSRPLCAV